MSEALTPFIEAKYVRIDALQEGQPSFFQGGALGTFRCNNPFLTAQNPTALQSTGRCANPLPAHSRFPASTSILADAAKSMSVTHNRIGGVEGTFNEDWRYELSLNYGKLKTRMRSLNNLVLFDVDGNPTATACNECGTEQRGPDCLRCQCRRHCNQ